MKNFNPDIESDGQFKLDLQSKPKIIIGGDNEQHDDITHLSPDDLIELEVTDPEAYQALMAQIEKQQKLEEIERRAQEVEDEERITSIAEKKGKEESKKTIDELYKKDPNEPYWQR